MSYLELKDISFSYQAEETILGNISFNIKEKEFLGILGPNGGGKSTLLKIIVGLLKPTSGSLNYQSSGESIPFHEISYVPQTDVLETPLPLRIKDVVKFGRVGSNRTKSTGLSVSEALKIVGLSKSPETSITNLSGGERQRVLLAKALMNSPKLLVLDEPTKGLDGAGQDQLLELIEKIKVDFGSAIILVDHNINQVVKHCDKILCLNRSLHWHDKKELLNKETLEDIYHCEFEHLKLHDSDSSHLDSPHKSCSQHDHNHDHKDKGNN